MNFFTEIKVKEILDNDWTTVTDYEDTVENRRESWVEFTGWLVSTGQITQTELDTWTNPY